MALLRRPMPDTQMGDEGPGAVSAEALKHVQLIELVAAAGHEEGVCDS